MIEITLHQRGTIRELREIYFACPKDVAEKLKSLIDFSKFSPHNQGCRVTSNLWVCTHKLPHKLHYGWGRDVESLKAVWYENYEELSISEKEVVDILNRILEVREIEKEFNIQQPTAGHTYTRPLNGPNYINDIASFSSIEDEALRMQESTAREAFQRILQEECQRETTGGRRRR